MLPNYAYDLAVNTVSQRGWTQFKGDKQSQETYQILRLRRRIRAR